MRSQKNRGTERHGASSGYAINEGKDQKGRERKWERELRPLKVEEGQGRKKGVQ